METKLTPLYLKTASQKFDLQTIIILDLSNRSVGRDLGSLPECINLVHLNLSRNRIQLLTGIDKLTNLKILDLSYNNLTTIDVIRGCLSL